MHVPKGWGIVSLGDISQVSSGGTPDRGDSKCWENGTIPWVTTGEISFSEITDTREKITELGLKSSAAKVFPKGTILMAMYGQGKTRGQVAKLGIDASTNQACAAIILKPEYDCEFYFQFLNSKYEQLRSIGNEGTQKNLNGGLIKEILVPAPQYSEQKKIAKILSTWDKAIEKLEALIAAKQKRKKALMQQFLTGRKRFAGVEGEWKEIAIRQMGKVVSGGTPDTNIREYWDGDILWVTPTDVTASKNRFISDTTRKITQRGQKDSSATIMPAGSLLVCTRATIGIMSISTTDITTNQGFKNLVPNKNFDVEFLYYLFSHSKDKFIRYACGSTFFELSKKDFEKLTFKCPGFQEQQKIASVLTAADTEIETHQKQLSALKQQKKGLMQQLLTGKKRVKVDGDV